MNKSQTRISVGLHFYPSLQDSHWPNFTSRWTTTNGVALVPDPLYEER
jgi:hypothetical protein